MYLSEQQRAFFKTFGFLAFPGLFADDIAAITQAFEDIWQRHGGGHGGKPMTARRGLRWPSSSTRTSGSAPCLTTRASCGIAGGLLGDDFNYSGSDGNFYVGDTRWHSDGWRVNGILYIKMAFYLDPVGADSGCLRVIPGSRPYRGPLCPGAADGDPPEPGAVGDRRPRSAGHCAGDPARRSDPVQPQHQACRLRRRRAAAHVHDESLPALSRRTAPGAARDDRRWCAVLGRSRLRRDDDPDRGTGADAPSGAVDGQRWPSGGALA